MTTKKGLILGPIFFILIAMLSIQTGASLAKQLFPVVGAAGATALRLSFAAVILMAVFRPWRQRLSRSELLSVFIYGAALGGMNFLFYLALERIPLGITVALEFTGPLGVALFASRKPIDFFLAGLAALGIILLLPITQLSAPLDPLGILLAVAAGLCWAFYIIFGQKVGSTVHGGTATSLGMCVAALVIIPICLLKGASPFSDVSILPLAILVAILSSALPYSLEMVALKKLPTHTFGILMSLEPAVGAMIGFVFLKEHLTGVQWLAIFCIIAASLAKRFFSEEVGDDMVTS